MVGRRGCSGNKIQPCEPIYPLNLHREQRNAELSNAVHPIVHSVDRKSFGMLVWPLTTVERSAILMTVSTDMQDRW